MLLTQIPSGWLFGLAGGLMIGSAAALLLLFNGRIMGASGILGSLVDGSGAGSQGERLAFLAALIGVPALVVALRGAPATHVSGNLALMVMAGLLVGLGTRMANGCTSGHGVCGMARFSLRSIVATLVYLAAGFAALYVGRHLLGAF